jgi:hypothetical protein
MVAYLFRNETSESWTDNSASDSLFGDGPDKQVDVVNLEQVQIGNSFIMSIVNMVSK